MNQQEYSKKYYIKNRKHLLEKARKNHLLNRDARLKHASERYYSDDRLPQIMFSRARQRAKEKGIKFDLELSDIVIPKTCPIFGFKLNRAFGGKPKPNSPSLDRIIPKLGYIKGNVEVISYKANMIKNNATFEEIVKLAEYVQNKLTLKKKITDEPDFG